jgi:hypothetical protein
VEIEYYSGTKKVSDVGAMVYKDTCRVGFVSKDDFMKFKTELEHQSFKVVELSVDTGVIRVLNSSLN